MTQAALAGIKILDLSGDGPGPFCTMVLADLGAEVTLVDRPLPGSKPDDGIPNANIQGLPRPHFDAFLRNKRRIGLNLKQDGALEVVRRLAANADVVVVQMRPGKPEALGIGYDDLSSINSKLVYCMITGYGESGPLRDQAGHDVNYLGVSGVLSLFDRRAVSPPPPNVIADYGAAGMMAATAILAALQARHTTGEGQHIDISMTDASTYLAAQWVSAAFDPYGDPFLVSDYPPYDVYPCADGGLITIGCVEPHFWYTLCEAIERPELAKLAGTPNDHHRLRDELKRTFALETRAAWLDRLARFDLPVGTVNTLEELPNDPQLRAREMVVSIETDHGPVKQVGIGAKLSRTPGSIRRVGVERGADTTDLLLESGYPAAQIEEFRSKGAIFG